MFIRLAAAGVAFVLASPAFAQDVGMVLVNQTGKSVKTIEFSDPGKGEWKPNGIDPEVKKTEPLASGKQGTLFADTASGKCVFDVRLTFADDTNMVWPGVNVCDNWRVTMKLKGAAPDSSYN